MSATPDLIKLDPPLPWVSRSGTTGFVLGLAKDHLLLQLNHNDAEKPTVSGVTVHLGGPQRFYFAGTAEEKSERLLLYPVDAQEKALLQDMLGQLRKGQHIDICRDLDVEASDRYTGFERVHLMPEALPLVDPADLSTQTQFLGRSFALPLLITGMTGGIDQGAEINRRLAVAAEAYGIPMGVGSQRIALENPAHASIFRVKHHAPRLFLIGNLGMAQLVEADALSLCQRAVDMIEADALAIHLNLVQESIQVEGDRHFKGFLDQLERICRRLSVPVIIKEVGSGISPSSARRLNDLGVSAIDIGGRGGTSWAHIEGLRSRSPLVQDLGRTFRDWGIPTAFSLAAVRQSLPDLPLIATGGIRDGVTVAKARALGADLTGIGLPLLRAALRSEEGPHEVLEGFRRELEIAMLASGCATLSDLPSKLGFGLPLADNFERFRF